MALLFCLAILLCTSYVDGQYTIIWYDDMQQNNGWTPSGDVTFAYNGESCTAGLCTKTSATNHVMAWIRRSTDVSKYHSLRLKYSLGTRNLESEENDECSVYYSYTSNNTASRTPIQSHKPPDGERHFYPNNTLILPDASSANTVSIWLEACCAIGGDFCYWDSVSLEGIFGESGDKYRNNEPIYIAVIICLSAIIFIYLLYKFKSKIATLLRATRGNNTNFEPEIVDEIEPGTAENNAPDEQEEARENEDACATPEAVEGKRDNDDIDESDDSDGLYVKYVESETTTKGNTPKPPKRREKNMHDP